MAGTGAGSCTLSTQPLEAACRVTYGAAQLTAREGWDPFSPLKASQGGRRALHAQGLMALIQPIICCVRAQSAREFVREFSGGATPHRSGVGHHSRGMANAGRRNSEQPLDRV